VPPNRRTDYKDLFQARPACWAASPPKNLCQPVLMTPMIGLPEAFRSGCLPSGGGAGGGASGCLPAALVSMTNPPFKRCQSTGASIGTVSLTVILGTPCGSVSPVALRGPGDSCLGRASKPPVSTQIVPPASRPTARGPNGPLCGECSSIRSWGTLGCTRRAVP
jgi:hypothetical protein